jgi:hypothetical protein
MALNLINAKRATEAIYEDEYVGAYGRTMGSNSKSIREKCSTPAE